MVFFHSFAATYFAPSANCGGPYYTQAECEEDCFSTTTEEPTTSTTSTSTTSTSTVGLPRESSTSRPITNSIVLTRGSFALVGYPTDRVSQLS